MRLLHVGWGFRPWRTGGLIAYTEDVLRHQARRGHEVAYFFAGRHATGRGPHLRRWKRDGVAMFELWNGAVPAGIGTQAPDLDLAEPAAEAAFAAVLDRWRPDLVHVQELLGLPSSLLEVARGRGVPVVLSLEDYQPLCPTLKLHDAQGENCRRRLPGTMCRVCCAAAPADNAHLTRPLWAQAPLPGGERTTMAANNALAALRWRSPLTPVLDRLRPLPGPPAPPAGAASAGAEAYDRRRRVNAQRVGTADAVLAMSHRVAEIVEELGVDPARLRVLHFTLDHLARIRPDPRVEPGDPLVFTTLNGCASAEKGVGVLLEALAALRDAGLEERFRLDVWGFVDLWARETLTGHPSVRLRGNYTGADLERMLAGADVGIVPSVWEEAYGYTGVELLAAGLPVIGNDLGGIRDYVVPGETGWRNRSATGEELAEHMGRLIGSPREVAVLRERLRRERPAAVKPMAAHLDELDAVYGDVLAARPSSAPRSSGGIPRTASNTPT